MVLVKKVRERIILRSGSLENRRELMAQSTGNQQADDLVDAATGGPLRRKIGGYADKVSGAVDRVKDAWEGSPLKQAYNKYVGGGSSAKDAKKYVPGQREKELGFTAARNNAPTKKAAPRKRVAGKK